MPPGEHAVRAWLRLRAGRPDRYEIDKATVEPGDLAELTMKLEPQFRAVTPADLFRAR